ncbi:hypothetical protein [Halomonas sp. H10-9-1]|uniref:hypothetical protein n=1 Tax=Halomonas sp. H10-9-1 TaxID=2950871 RepID=UPI0032E04D83
MMRSGARLAGLIVTVLASVGCATKYPVTFDSYPQGATLICNGTNWGYTPKTLYYDSEVKQQNYLSLRSCSANWSSGARELYGSVSMQEFPDGVRQTLQRPDVPGFQQDAEFSLKVQQLNVQKRQAQSAQQPVYSQQSVSCKKSFDISGQLYQFAQAYCPPGYYKAL